MLLERNIYVHGLRKITVEGTSAALHSALTIHGSRSYHNSAQSLKLNYTQLGCRKNHCVLLRFESIHFLSRYLSYKSTDRHRLSVNPPNFIHSSTHPNAHISPDPHIHPLIQTHIFPLINTCIHSRTFLCRVLFGNAKTTQIF